MFLTPGFFLLAGLLGTGVAAVKYGKRWAVFCMAWFVFALLPKTLVMIYGNFMLDHWGYTASIAVFIPLAYAITRGWHAGRKSIRAATVAVYLVC
jgi:hypothetical protein